MKFIFSPCVAKEFQKLEFSLQTQILQKISWFEQLQSPFNFSKILVNKVPTTYRFRIGDYRIIGTHLTKTNEFLILKIGHRKDIYRD